MNSNKRNTQTLQSLTFRETHKREDAPMTDEVSQPGVTFVDDPHAPEHFVSGVSGIWVIAGNVHITVESVRIDHITQPGPVNHVVIGQLVMPVGAAQALAAQLYGCLQQQGLNSVPIPPKEKMQ